MTQYRLKKAIERACLLEVSARKVGNVHPQASFVDLTWRDFAGAATAVAEPLANASTAGIGPAVLAAIRATQTVRATNINLGIALLLAPLAAVTDDALPADDVARLIDKTTLADAAAVYEAIRLAVPGGLGKVDEGDVTAPPPAALKEVMTWAADRDQIAAQYATGFRDLLTAGPAMLAASWEAADQAADSSATGLDPAPLPWELAILGLQLRCLAAWGDTLIHRKCGPIIANEARNRAQHVLQHNWPVSRTGWAEWHSLDEWLRADGHRRNPGSTADLIAAILLIELRRGRDCWPDSPELEIFGRECERRKPPLPVQTP